MYSETSSSPMTPGANLREKRAQGMAMLADLHMRRRALGAELARVEAALATVESDIEGIDKALQVI